ncbi:MAG: BamA/TamA family outer membrane protein [bacterium]
MSGRRGLKGISPGFRVGDKVFRSQLEQGRERIRQVLFDRGFFWVEVELDTTIDECGIRVVYWISRLVQAKIGGWQFTGNESLDDKRLEREIPRKGQGFTSGVLAQAESGLLSTYARAGYPFAGVKCIGVRESAGQVFPSFSIEEGPRVKISFITFSNTAVQNDRYFALLRQCAGYRGEVYYTPDRVRIWKRNLERIGWIVVDSEEIVIRQTEYGIRFWVSEKHRGEFNGVVGYAPESRRLMGWTQVQLFNILNTGRRVRARWYSAFKETRYQLEYTEPWIFRTPLSLSAAVEHNVFDTSYAQTIVSLTGRFINDGIEFSLGSGFDRTVSENLKRKLWVQTGIVFDSRNRAMNPREGINLRVDTRAGELQIQNNGSGMMGWVESDLEPVVAVFRGLIWVNKISLRAVFSELMLEEPDLYQVGGIQNIRGYREGSFFADRLGWWNCEWRYHLIGNSRLHIFFDAGLFSQCETKEWSWLSGYGVGGRWRTKLGIIGIDFGIPLAEGPTHGKIHLNLQMGF